MEWVATFGGIPGYLERLDPKRSLTWNVRHRLIERSEPLYEEVPFLLHQEMREPRVYFAVLAAIASGARKFGEISSKVGLDRANLTRYLAILAEVGLVEREVSITERHPEKSRKGLYRICDPFVGTWFRFVHPYRDELERGLASEVMRSRIAPDLARFLPIAVEPVVRDLARAEGIVGKLPFKPVYAGRHWTPTAEFDLVLLNAERTQAFVGELKWTARDVPLSTLDDLRRRVASEPAFRDLSLTLGLLVRGRVMRTRRLAKDERIVELGAR
jgi:AAA+ ATPase superfamily predicted ATPase